MILNFGRFVFAINSQNIFQSMCAYVDDEDVVF